MQYACICSAIASLVSEQKCRRFLFYLQLICKNISLTYTSKVVDFMFRAAAAREAPSVMENSVEPATPEPSVTPSHGSSSFDIGTTIDTLRLLPSSAANVAVWRRQFPLDSGAALSLCINEFAPPFECTVNMNDGVPETLLSRLSLLDSHGQLAWLRADIALLVQTFAAFANSDKLRIYFGAVRTDQCRKGPRMDHSVDDRCRAAPMARREEGAYSPYVTEEQRRQRGWIGAENDRVILSRALRSMSTMCASG
jgi:hypothetical protein